MTEQITQHFKLKPFQDDFIYSPAPYPAFIAGWAVGKSMCLIFRAMLYSENVPGNLGVIFRKQKRDLEDSTMLDFEKYTGLKINNESADVVLPNKSRIMFRHIEELSGSKQRKGENIQNMNLGWFGIEQGEELPTDNEFFFLFGRLRRVGEPTDYFKSLGLPPRSGFIIGNVYGDNWIKKQWKVNEDKDFELTEATTYDNKENLPKDYLDGLEILKKRKPEIYNRYVMNDWSADIEAKVFHGIDKCIAGLLMKPVAEYHYVGGSDLAKKQDWFTVFIICRQTNHLVYFNRFRRQRWGLVKAQISGVSRIYHHALMQVDSTGVGDPILEDLEDSGTPVTGLVFTNKSKEKLIDKLIVAIENRLITFPNILQLITELQAFESIMLPSGKIRYQAPPGIPDDCVYGLALAVDQLDIYQSKRELPKPVHFWQRVRADLMDEKIDKMSRMPETGKYTDVMEEGYQDVI